MLKKITIFVLFLFTVSAVPTTLLAADSNRMKSKDGSNQISKALEAGINAYNRGQYDAAKKYFSFVLEQNPHHGRARLELARTLYALGQFEESKDEFEFVLKFYDPPNLVRTNIKRFLKAIDRATSPISIQGIVSVAGFYDNNVNFGPDKRMVTLAPVDFGFTTVDEFSVSPDSLPKESGGLITMGTAILYHDCGIPRNWVDYVALNYYQTHLDKNQEFDTLLLGGVVGFKKQGAVSILDLPLRYQYLERGGEAAVDTIGTIPSYVVQTSDEHVTQTRGHFEFRNYRLSNERDSYFVEVGQLHHYLVAHAMPVTYTFHLNGFWEKSDQDEFTNYGARGGVGGRADVISKTTVGLSVDLRARWYDEREVFAPEDREDQELITTVNIRRLLGPETSLALTYQNSQNFSTIDLYDYERDLVMLNLTWEL